MDECSRLESGQASDGLVGSNPTPSANHPGHLPGGELGVGSEQPDPGDRRQDQRLEPVRLRAFPATAITLARKAFTSAQKEFEGCAGPAKPSPMQAASWR